MAMALKTCRCCCCVMPLEKAAKIIGIIFTILGAISVVYIAVNLSKVQHAHSLGQQYLDPENAEHADLLRQVEFARNMQIVGLFFSLLFTLFSALLVAGVYKANKCLVLAFCVYFLIYLVLLTARILYAFYDPTALIDENSLEEMKKQGDNIAQIVLYVILAITLVILLFFWYLAAVVFSYYKELAGGSASNEHRQLSQF